MDSESSNRSVDGGDEILERFLAHLDAYRARGTEMSLAAGGLEFLRHGQAENYLESLQQTVLDWLLARTSPVARVDDPYAKANVAYVVICIDPCSPVIREVAEGTPNSFATLVDAKDAARRILQTSLERASSSLADLRQVGIDRIGFVSL